MSRLPVPHIIDTIKTKLGFDRTMTAPGEDIVDAVNKQSQQINELGPSNTLTSDSTTAALSAAQGKTLKSLIDDTNAKIPTGFNPTGTAMTANTGVFNESGILVAELGYSEGGYIYIKINDVYLLMCNKVSNTPGQAYNISVFKGQSYIIEKTAGNVKFYTYIYN